MPFLIETKKWGNTLYLTPSGGWSCSPYLADKFPSEGVAQVTVDACVHFDVERSDCMIVEHTFEMTNQ